ncbi:hypothetical protein ABXS75_18705 [Roseburia hominis]
MGKLNNFDGVDSFEVQPRNKVETIPSVTENDRKKLEHINKSRTLEYNSSELKEGGDSNRGKNSIEKGRLNNRDLSRQPERQGDLVQTGTAIENPRYGTGGGKQYFIHEAHQKPNANGNLILKNGSLNKTGETNLQYFGSPYLPENKSESKSEEQKVKPTISVNYSPLSKSEKAELEQLDKNTMDERGLARVMDNKKEQEEEYWKHPLTNQEVRGTNTNPDAWSNPRKLKSGEKFYQLRPSNAGEASEYFTNGETVNKCRKENGDVDVGKLLKSLQINPGENKNWTLREYEYRKNN